MVKCLVCVGGSATYILCVVCLRSVQKRSDIVAEAPIRLFTTMITNNNDDDDDNIEIHKVKYVDDYDSNIGSTCDDSIKRYRDRGGLAV